jgi:hypothetical protein
MEIGTVIVIMLIVGLWLGVGLAIARQLRRVSRRYPPVPETLVWDVERGRWVPEGEARPWA